MSPISRRNLLRSGLAVSASSLVSRSAWARGYRSARRRDDTSAAALPALAPREKLLFDFGWKFQFGNSNDPAKDLGFGNDQGDFAKTGDFNFAKVGYDDSKWRTLNLPHDWAVELPFVWDEQLKSHGYKPLGRRYPDTSVGWYRREFDIPASDQGRRIVGRIRRRIPRRAGLRQRLLHRPQQQRLRALPLRHHRFPRLRAEELHRGARRRDLRRRLVLRGRGNLPARMAHQDRCAAPGAARKLRALQDEWRLGCAVARDGGAEGRQAARKAPRELADSRCRGQNRGHGRGSRPGRGAQMARQPSQRLPVSRIQRCGRPTSPISIRPS